MPQPSLAIGFNRPLQEQVDFFRAKLSLPTERWDDIWQVAHDRAFMVAGAMQADLLDDLRQAVDAAIAQGQSIQEFRANFEAIVAKHGWTGWTGEGTDAGRAWRTRIIYQTNMATSYAAGRYKQLNDPGLVALRPYWKYHHADFVMHPRPLHVAWNGLVLPRDHPFWETHYPPNGWGCHCWVTAASQAEYEAAQASGKAEPPEGWQTISPKTGAPAGIDQGWAYAPGANTDTSLRDMVSQKLIDYPPAITRALSRDLNRYLAANDPPSDFARDVLTDRTITYDQLLGFPDNFERIEQDTGQDVKGYIGILPADIPRHVERSHGHDGSGQRPIQSADYDQVWQVLTEADTLETGHASTRGLDSIVAWKAVGGEEWRAVFEIRPGKKTRLLALASLVIKTG